MRGILFLFLLSTHIFANSANIASGDALVVSSIKQEIENLDAIIDASNWNVHYENFVKYDHIHDELILMNLELKKNLSSTQKEEISKRILALQEQLNLLRDYKDLNFIQSLSAPETIEVLPKLTNPLAIIEGLSHIKKLKNEKEEYTLKYNDFKNLVEKIRERNSQIKKLVALNPSKSNADILKLSDKKLSDFEQALQFASVSFSVYEKKVDDEITRVNVEIKAQSLRAANMLVTIIFVIAVSFLLKFIARKYIKDNERYYTATKIINFINVNFIFLILLFAYIENITYLVTILGFASAGLAIAMKDMFMSMLGWCVIVFGGSFRVGDRIKVTQNDSTYVGDIIDISFLRITIYEELTWESYTRNRRSGRIIFIPNNYVFTDLIANYTHHGMRTVLDGIDITITFDSNLEKAEKIVEKIVVQYSKGYTELAKKTMLKLQDEYSIRNPRVEPRFFMFFEHWGMRISAWYMTSSYTSLSLRSTISKEIVKEFSKHEDIKIAYPSQNLYLGKNTSVNLKDGETL